METTDSLVDRLYKGILNRVNVEYKEAINEGPPPAEVLYGEGTKFERIRRCTGYLSGDYQTRFNNAKQAEVEDRTSSNTFRRTEQYHES